MNRLIISLFLLSFSLISTAQTHLHIYQKGNATLDIPLTQIDSITFVDVDKALENAGLAGSWLWGSTEAGYYEFLTFNDDHNYTYSLNVHCLQNLSPL